MRSSEEYSNSSEMRHCVLRSYLRLPVRNSPLRKTVLPSCLTVDRLRSALDRQAFLDYCQWKSPGSSWLLERVETEVVTDIVTKRVPFIVNIHMKNSGVKGKYQTYAGVTAKPTRMTGTRPAIMYCESSAGRSPRSLA